MDMYKIINKRVIIRAVVVTLITIVASELLTYFVLVYVHGKMELVALISAGVIPLLVAFPTALWMGTQETKLEIANLKLQQTCNELDNLRNQAVLQARLDPMTGLYNREYFFNTVQETFDADVQGAMVMLDVDHFKSINDRFGHAAGDAALLAIVDALKGTLRKCDIIGRIGGEEFAIFLPEIDEFNAEMITKRMGQAVCEIDFVPAGDQPINLSISIGGVMRSKLQNYDEMMRVADGHMYRAKNLGRNRVVFSNDREFEFNPTISASAA